MPKRYLVFSYERFEAGGGWSDCRGVFTTLGDAKKCDVSVPVFGGVVDPARAYIVDIETESIVYEFEIAKQVLRDNL